MGNKFPNKSSFQEKDWKEIASSDYKTILLNTTTLKTVEKHEGFTDLSYSKINRYLQWRSELPSQSCVTELYQYAISKQGICNTNIDIFVIVERLSKLDQIYTISKPQAFIIIRDLATALRYLVKKFGYFSPQPSMIGINSQGRARIWIHQNSAVFTPEPDILPIQSSQLVIMNNLIRLIEPRVYRDDNFPIQYPHNLDFKTTVEYIDQIFRKVKQFRVDKVYLDRDDFAKNYRLLREREQKEEKSRILMRETSKRLQQIEELHQNLKQQQLQLLEKQKKLNNSALKYNKPMSFCNSNLTFHSRESHLNHYQPAIRDQARIIDNRGEHSGKRKLGWTASTQKSETQVFQQPVIQQISHPQPPIQKNSPQQLQFQKPTSNPQKANPLPPLPPKPQKKQPQQNYGQKNDHYESMKKEIQMVDSMIVVEEDRLSDKNLEYIQSRIVRYNI